MAIDLAGGIFSAVSLAFRPSFDAFAAVTYLLVVVSQCLLTIMQSIDTPIVSRRTRTRGSCNPEPDRGETSQRASGDATGSGQRRV